MRTTNLIRHLSLLTEKDWDNIFQAAKEFDEIDILAEIDFTSETIHDVDLVRKESWVDKGSRRPIGTNLVVYEDFKRDTTFLYVKKMVIINCAFCRGPKLFRAVLEQRS